MAYGDDVYRICRRGSFLHRLFCLQWFLPPGTGLTAATYIPQYNAVRTSVHFSRMRFLGSRTRDPGDGTDTLLPPVGPCPIRARGRTAWRTRPTRAVHPRTRDSHRIRTSAWSPGRPFPTVLRGFGGPEHAIPRMAPTPSYLRTEDWHQRTAPFIPSHGSSIPYRL